MGLIINACNCDAIKSKSTTTEEEILGYFLQL